MLSHQTKGLYTVRIYPSGDFSGGRNAKAPTPHRDDATHPLGGISTDTYYHDGKKHQIVDLNAIENRRLPLGLSVATNSHRPRTKRGQNGITGLGKKKIRSAAVVVAKSVKRNCTTFATCTVPTVTRAENETICANWSELIRQLKQEIMRSLLRAGITNPDYFYVSEIQEKRYQQHGLLTLHLHMVFQGRNHHRENWAISKEKLRVIWARLLGNLLGRTVNCDQATRVESPRGSLVKELGKYLSKGGKVLGDVKANGDQDLLPPSYWGVSRKLNKKINAAIRVLTQSDAVWFLDSLRDFGELVKYRQICLENYGGICVGWSGFIKESELLEKLLG